MNEQHDTVPEIERALEKTPPELSEEILPTIRQLKLHATESRNEANANYFWCLEEIYNIQAGFISVFKMMKEGDFEKAWITLESLDSMLGILETNCQHLIDANRFHLGYIGKAIKDYQKLFPYQYFFSRECVIEEDICSICGKPFSLRNNCGHIPGHVYMGELCARIITKAKLTGISLVRNPVDRYAIVKIPGQEYNYRMLEALIAVLDGPFDQFSVAINQITASDYESASLTDKCPCGSGLTYKECHYGIKEKPAQSVKLLLPYNNKAVLPRSEEAQT